MNKFELDIVHNIEELAELQKELTKWLRGNIRQSKLIKEINDVKIALENIENYFDDILKKG